MIRPAFALFIASTLTACSLGPDYQRPENTAPPKFALQEVFAALEVDAGVPTAVPQTQWWQGFQDPLLNDLVDAGLQNSFILASAHARLREVEADARAAGASFRPQMDLTGTGSVSGSKADGNTRPQSESAGLTAGISLMPDLFGQGRRQKEAARARLAEAKADLQQTLLTISSSITADYLTLRGNQEQLRLLQDAVALQEKTLAIVRTRFKAGLAPELDMRRSETAVESLRADIPPLIEEIENARNRVAIATGGWPGNSGSFDGALRNPGPVPRYQAEIPEMLPFEVLTNRPDIMAAEARLQQTVALIGVAEAAFWPELELKTQVGISRSVVLGASPVDLLIATLSAAISQALLDGGQRGADLDAARARADQALAGYEQALREALGDVEAALAAVNSSRVRQKALEKAVASGERSVYQAEILYSRGLISFLNVVDAQRVLAAAEQKLARERTVYASRITRLFLAMGAATDKQAL